jgi:hypothetical protein
VEGKNDSEADVGEMMSAAATAVVGFDVEEVEVTVGSCDGADKGDDEDDEEVDSVATGKSVGWESSTRVVVAEVGTLVGDAETNAVELSGTATFDFAVAVVVGTDDSVAADELTDGKIVVGFDDDEILAKEGGASVEESTITGKVVGDGDGIEEADFRKATSDS